METVKLKRKPVTQEEVCEYFDYKDGLLYWKKIRKFSNKKIGDLAGRINSFNRRDLGLNNRVFYTSRLIFLYHHGWLPDYVDHIDRNTLNEKIENLRAATSSQNQANKEKTTGLSSKYKGVSIAIVNNGYKLYTYWYSLIYIDNKSKFLGSFKSEEAAALAYNKEAVKQFGEFANLNIIQL